MRRFADVSPHLRGELLWTDALGGGAGVLSAGHRTHGCMIGGGTRGAATRLALTTLAAKRDEESASSLAPLRHVSPSALEPLPAR